MLNHHSEDFYKNGTEFDTKFNKNSTFDNSFFSSDSSIMVQLNGPGFTATNSTLQSNFLEALFIGNLDEKVTEQMLSDIFRVYPSFVSAKICFRQGTQISLKHGYLNFAKREDALNAIYTFNYTYLLGKEIKIMPSMRHGAYKKSNDRNIIFLNLPKSDTNFTTRNFFEILSSYGRVISCKIDFEKGIGYCSFEDKKLAEKVAVLLNDSIFWGKKIKCSINDCSEQSNKSNLMLLKNESSLTFSQLKDFPKQNSVNSFIPRELKNKIQNGKTVLVKNLPVHEFVDDIQSFFEAYGSINKVYFVKKDQYKSGVCLIVYQKFRACENTFGYLNGTNYKGKLLKMEYINKKRTFITLANLSVICKKTFLKELIKQQGFCYRNLQITNYEISTTNYKGFIVATDETMAEKIYNFFNGKLLCGNVIYACRY